MSCASSSVDSIYRIGSKVTVAAGQPLSICLVPPFLRMFYRKAAEHAKRENSTGLDKFAKNAAFQNGCHGVPLSVVAAVRLYRSGHELGCNSRCQRLPGYRVSGLAHSRSNGSIRRCLSTPALVRTYSPAGWTERICT